MRSKKLLNATGNFLFPSIHELACFSRRSRNGFEISTGLLIKVQEDFGIPSDSPSSILFSSLFLGYLRVISPLSLSIATASILKLVEAISNVSLELLSQKSLSCCSGLNLNE